MTDHDPGPFRKAESDLKDIAKLLDDCLPKGMLFALVIFTPGAGGYASYASNGRREDMIRALREAADVIEAKADSPPGSNLSRH